MERAQKKTSKDDHASCDQSNSEFLNEEYLKARQRRKFSRQSLLLTTFLTIQYISFSSSKQIHISQSPRSICKLQNGSAIILIEQTTKKIKS